MGIGFGDRFRKWCIENGKEPPDDELVKAMNEAGKNIARGLRENRGRIAREIQFLGATLQNIAKRNRERT